MMHAIGKGFHTPLSGT